VIGIVPTKLVWRIFPAGAGVARAGSELDPGLNLAALRSGAQPVPHATNGFYQINLADDAQLAPEIGDVDR